MKRPRLTPFIYQSRGASRSPMKLHRILHGQRAVRTTKDKFGHVFHKTFEYPGIPHFDVIPGVIAVERKNITHIEKNFKHFNVPYIKAIRDAKRV